MESGSCKEVTIANEPLGGLVIKKMDSVTKEPLSEVTFKVTTTDGAVVGTSNGEFRTDENGYITIPDLEPGGYVVQEVKAKEGYLLDNTPKTIRSRIIRPTPWSSSTNPRAILSSTSWIRYQGSPGGRGV